MMPSAMLAALGLSLGNLMIQGPGSVLDFDRDWSDSDSIDLKTGFARERLDERTMNCDLVGPIRRVKSGSLSM